jgi:regulator of sigma E protease
MTDALTAIISVTIVLGVMIFVHEWGHFIAAKLCGVRVDVFSFGFGTRLWGVKRGDTDYRISALPLGGYVRMAGDNPIEERTGAPYEFLSRPRWQRVIIAVAGPTMNLLLAFLILWGAFWMVGVPTPTYEDAPPQVAAVPQYSPVVTGVQPGDLIVSVNGVKTPTWDKVRSAFNDVKPGDLVSLGVIRNGAQQKLTGKVPSTPQIDVASLVGYPSAPATVGEVGIGTPAERAGLKQGDEFISINGKRIATWMQLMETVQHSSGKQIDFVVRRDAKEVPISITPMKGIDPDGNPVWQVGVLPKVTERYQRESFANAFVFAGAATLNVTYQVGDVIAGLFNGKVSISQLQGVVGIARESGRAARRGPMDMVLFMAAISVNLGLLNLLPIPILDGGHVLLLVIEGAIRRDLSISFKERFVQVGLVFLLAIFGFVMYSDIWKWVQSRLH